MKQTRFAKVLALSLVLGFTTIAHAMPSEDLMAIDSVEIYEVEDGGEKAELGDVESLGGQKDYVTKTREVIAVADELIAFGEKVYKIVEKGRPVLNVDSEPVSVLPKQGDTYLEARDLNGWRAPVVKKYRVEFKNLYGMEVTSLTLMLVYSYGGQHNGKGAYITGAQIKPVELNVMWGYRLDVSFKLHSLTPMGTAENPVAGATLMLDYKVSTVMQTRTGSMNYFITGNGETTAL